tara:strand:- start:5959 stop:6678 length:720 start_codon:yes stop_codon:yes gene_type:complete
MNILAVIPARGGSVRVPRKNIKKIGSLPLIAHTILAVKNSKFISRLILSTDDQEIMDVANEYGCETPFRRSKELSEDVDTALVTIDAVNKCEEIYNEKYDAVLTLEPTSPFRTTETIDKCIKLMANSESIDSVVTVSSIEGNRPEWMVKIDANKKVTPYATPFKLDGKPIIKLCARQDFPPLYKINGVVFLTRKKLLSDNTLIGFSPSIVETSEKEAIDIDTPIDLAFANQIALNNEIN